MVYLQNGAQTSPIPMPKKKPYNPNLWISPPKNQGFFPTSPRFVLRMSFGSVLKDLRSKRHLTLQALAERVGCAKSYLSEIENGRRSNPPSRELLDRLEEALGAEPNSLVRVALWERTPREIREQARTLGQTLGGRLRQQQELASRLSEALAQSRLGEDGALHGPLEELYKSGELRRMIEQLEAKDAAMLSAALAGLEDASTQGGLSWTGEAADTEERPPALPGASCGEPSGPAAAKTRPPKHSPADALPYEVPLINKIAAGYPREFTDLGYPARVADEYVRCPQGWGDASDPDAFAARVVGDSMAPDYVEGDIVIFSPAREVRSGMDCFVRLEGEETTFKRVYFDPAPGTPLRLQPINSAHAPTLVPREKVLGLHAAVTVMRRIV